MDARSDVYVNSVLGRPEVLLSMAIQRITPKQIIRKTAITNHTTHADDDEAGILFPFPIIIPYISLDLEIYFKLSELSTINFPLQVHVPEFLIVRSM